MVGYACMSMSDRSNARQLADLERAGCKTSHVFSDRAGGRHMDRPGWRNCWRYLRTGDVLVVLSIDRLGPNLIDVIEAVTELRKRQVGLKVLSGAIDSTLPSGRFMLDVVVALAEWERELIVERTRNGLRVAKEKGRVGGRNKEVSDDQVREAFRRRDAGEGSILEIAKGYGVSSAALYKRRRELPDSPPKLRSKS